MVLDPVTDAPRRVLAFNSGSSSLKFGLFRVDGTQVEALARGEAQALGTTASPLRVRDAGGAGLLCEDAPLADARAAFERIAALFDRHALPAPQAIGHRIVHGGPRLRHHTPIDPAVAALLRAAIPYAPLHVPPALAIVEAAASHFPGLPQVACLDTAFHADLPPLTRTLPVALELRAEGVERYGFHGLSCASILAQWRGPLPARLVIAHLGSGASVTAVRDGRSVDTSMGMTPSGGQMMASRSGDLDPGVLAWLARERGYDAAALERLIDHRSGLLGVSGLSGDPRRLREADTPEARLALDMFALSARRTIAGMAASLGGIDALVFTGGIGEHDAAMRAAVCAGFDWAGVTLDADRNARHVAIVSPPGAHCAVHVMTTDEEGQIARHTADCLAAPSRA